MAFLTTSVVFFETRVPHSSELEGKRVQSCQERVERESSQHVKCKFSHCKLLNFLSRDFFLSRISKYLE